MSGIVELTTSHTLADLSLFSVYTVGGRIWKGNWNWKCKPWIGFESCSYLGKRKAALLGKTSRYW